VKNVSVQGDGEEDALNGAAAVDWLFFDAEDKVTGKIELGN